MVSKEELRQEWRGRSDAKLLAAAEGLGEYNPTAQEVIVEELRRRDLKDLSEDVFPGSGGLHGALGTGEDGLVDGCRRRGGADWAPHVIHAGHIVYECPHCSHTQHWPSSTFLGEGPSAGSGLRRAKEVFLLGRPIIGLAVTWGIGLLAVAVVSLAMGKHSVLADLAGVAVFFALRPIIVPALMRKLPIWWGKCSECGRTYEVAVALAPSGEAVVEAFARSVGAGRTRHQGAQPQAADGESAPVPDEQLV